MEGKVSRVGNKVHIADFHDGKINGSAPITFDGSINPLTRTAFVKAKATDRTDGDPVLDQRLSDCH